MRRLLRSEPANNAGLPEGEEGGSGMRRLLRSESSPGFVDTFTEMICSKTRGCAAAGIPLSCC